jgi:hypothetical protein
MTSPYTGKQFTRKDALRLENANDEIMALKKFVGERSIAYEEMLKLDVNKGYGRNVDPFFVEKKTNDAGVEIEVFKIEVSFGDSWHTRYVPVEFVFSDGEFERKYREAQEMLASFSPIQSK